MPPRITDSTIWHQAEMLMQPAFIRLVDNIRKQLDVSSWKGTYQDVLVWSPGTTDETKATVTGLVQELETATPERVSEIKQTLAKLPMPHPGYHLCLQRQEQREEVDLWELCYQVCFQNYTLENEVVSIDTSLIDQEGEVDWNTLDLKAKQIVEDMFNRLPHPSAPSP
ncbi:MAG: hypothetical protein IGS39_12575 [Calothrix sp. C42_A2020_038]|nr:hypothetical protein [Calothrix sp. C42_A2020_038]